MADQILDSRTRVIDLLTQQRFLYRQLRELAQQQTSLIDGSDPEMLLKVLAGRQRLIDKLTAIDKELVPIRADWQKIAAGLSNTQRQEVQFLVTEVEKILGEILVRDEKDTKRLSGRQQQVAAKIQTAAAGKRMNQAYTGDNQYGQSRYFDATSG